MRDDKFESWELRPSLASCGKVWRKWGENVRLRGAEHMYHLTKKVYYDIYARRGGTSVEPIIVMFLFNNYWNR